MNKLTRKCKIFALLLMLITIMAISCISIVNAQQLPKKKTFAYIGAIPNPVGVKQEVLLHVGITEPVGTAGAGWENLSVEIIRPDGNTEYIRNIKTDSTGGTGVVYVPEIVGTYRLRTVFPEQVFGNVLYMASYSDWLELVVQEEPAPPYPEIPLPKEYWTRPIDAQIREWSAISGSWLATPENLFVPYNEGPESPHILWVKPLTIGGLVGGEYDGLSFEIGDAYEGKWTGLIGPYRWVSSGLILAGRLYYQHTTRDRPVVYTCVDLHTGEELWSKTFLDNRTISFGQIFYWDSFNMHGAFAYLWVVVGNNWHAFDAYTGNWQFSVTNVPPVGVTDPKLDFNTPLFGPKGEIYRYSINLQNGWIAFWNLTRVVMYGVNPPWSGSWGMNAHGRTFDGSRGIQWNKTIPSNLPGGVFKIFLMDRLIGGSLSTKEVKLWGLSLKPGSEGTLLFSNTWTPPAYWAEGNVTLTGYQGGFVAWSLKDNIGVLWIKETREHYAFSLENGQYLWGPTQSQHYLDALDDSPANTRAITYGKLYSASVGGVLYCYDIKTGELLWKYEAYDPYNEILWATTWWLKLLFITDGKIYAGHTEHSPIDPRPRGAPFICLDAETGEVIWRTDGLFRQTRWGGRAIIGDSIIATMDTYDQRVYAIGKGPSATTVEAPLTGIPLGSSVVVRGTVMDVSPGTNDPAIKLRFPKGVPAVADESMGDWMLYVYKQFPLPEDVKGVEVTIDAMTPDGKWITIGTATTDATGMFSIMWTPESEGLYTIIATFKGSESYYASCAETTVGVTAAPPEGPELATAEQVEETQAAVAAMQPLITALIAIVIVCICLVVYDIYINRKMLRAAAK